MKHTTKFGLLAFIFLTITNITFAQEAQVQTQNKAQKTSWVDSDGDGICDNFGTSAQGSKQQNKMKKKGSYAGTGQGLGHGYGDGTASRPQDGTGFGKKNGAGKGTGLCTGTGNLDSGHKGSCKRGGK